MELQDVIRKRRMVRTYDLSRPIPQAIIERLLENAVRAPSAGFSQGWAFLVLDDREDIDKFRRAVTPEQDAEGWLAANVAAPLIIVPMSNREVYLDRYAEPEKGHTDRDTIMVASTVLGYRHRHGHYVDVVDGRRPGTRRMLLRHPATDLPIVPRSFRRS